MTPEEKVNETGELAEFSNEILDDLGGAADRYKGFPIPPVLVVDDDPDLLELLEAQLSALDRPFVCEQSAERACELLSNGGSQFSCIISDYLMPKMNGLDLLKYAKTTQPDALRVLISGEADLNVALDGINSGSIFRFLLKPMNMEQLGKVLDDVDLAYSAKLRDRMLNDDVRRLARWLKSANQRLEKNMLQLLNLNSYVVDIFSPFLNEVNQVTIEMVNQFCDLGILSPQECATLKLASNFHNIALLGIHRGTIKKAFYEPKALSEEENTMIREHPQKGAETVSFVGEDEAVSALIRSHHERWDGNGYPDGLSTHMIPKLAQYLALASYYAECPYYGGDVIWRIREEKEKAFGPAIIDAFDAIVENGTLPPKIREIHPSECLSGMTLARDVTDRNNVRILAEGRELSVVEIRYLRARAEDKTLSLPIWVRVQSALRKSSGR